MRKLLFARAAVLAASTASAAEGGATLGLGTKVGGDSLDITVPVNIAPGFRIEPFVGFSHTKDTDTVSNPLGDEITTDNEFDIGVAVLVTKEVAPSVELIGGGKIGLGFLSTKFEAPGVSASDSRTAFMIAAVGGAEYYFSPRFALGVEAELGLHTIDFSYVGRGDGRTTTIETASYVTAKVFFK